ncbi:MAG: pyridoxal phosphate-dependent aminotransferase [Candidatus Cloacimonetes bacterium]|nr:pyridoxal phosphate-dependent aminotransferase [Candidatus Cloacimonadota bacterium]
MLLKQADRMHSVQKSIIRQIFEAAQGKAINLGLGEIQFDMPQLLRNRAADVALNENCRYTENAGMKEFRDQVAVYYNNEIESEGVCITCGAAEAIHSCFTAYVNPGDEVMLADPTFLAYEASIKLNNGLPVYYRLDPDQGFCLDKEDFVAKISPKTRIVVICNPSNPLSKCLTVAELEFMADVCAQNNIMIICDEIYRELTYIPRQPSILDIYENSIAISGLSKAYCMTGWRIGWAASRITDYIKPIVVAHQYQSTCAPYISQKVGTLALSEAGRGTICQIKEQLTANYDLITDYFATRLPDIEYLPPDAAPYLFIRVDRDDTKLAAELSAKGVIVIPGCAFGQNGKNWIRISYALDTRLLIQGLDILASSLIE